MEDQKKMRERILAYDFAQINPKQLPRAERKEIYKMLKEGLIEPVGILKSWKNNMRPLNTVPPEEALEIRRKGQLAQQELRGEKKTAKQSLDTFLPLFISNPANIEANVPEDIIAAIKRSKVKVTQYDLVCLSMLAKAQQGNVKAAEWIRDTYGDKPIDQTHITADIITEADRALIANIAARTGITGAETAAIVDAEYRGKR